MYIYMYIYICIYQLTIHLLRTKSQSKSEAPVHASQGRSLTNIYFRWRFIFPSRWNPVLGVAFEHIFAVENRVAYYKSIPALYIRLYKPTGL